MWAHCAWKRQTKYLTLFAFFTIPKYPEGREPLTHQLHLGQEWQRRMQIYVGWNILIKSLSVASNTNSFDCEVDKSMLKIFLCRFQNMVLSNQPQEDSARGEVFTFDSPVVFRIPDLAQVSASRNLLTESWSWSTPFNHMSKKHCFSSPFHQTDQNLWILQMRSHIKTDRTFHTFIFADADATECCHGWPEWEWSAQPCSSRNSKCNARETSIYWIKNCLLCTKFSQKKVALEAKSLKFFSSCPS